MTEKFTCVNILNFINSFGEDSVQRVLSEFSCPLYSEIEGFVQHKAIEFSKKKMSITHLVFNEGNDLLGIIALAHKPINIKQNAISLSKTQLKRLERHVSKDDRNGSYNASAFLVAQLGINQKFKNCIKGSELMDICIKKIQSVQAEVGGGVVFAECEDKEKLLDFYSNEGFHSFHVRTSDYGVKYIQLFKVL
jgi:hypothetical protein